MSTQNEKRNRLDDLEDRMIGIQKTIDESMATKQGVARPEGKIDGLESDVKAILEALTRQSASRVSRQLDNAL